MHQDDPLAYGLDRLRGAHTVLDGRQGDQAERDLAAVTEALGRQRVARLQTVAEGAPAPEHLASRLGPLPDAARARDTWLGLALHIERRLDAGLDIEHRSSLSIAERLDRMGTRDPLDHARAIMATAEHHASTARPAEPDGPERWLGALEQALEAHRSIERQRSRELDLGVSL